jgi:putative oxidoreductase
MNTALLVLRLVPGILLIGHGLQKLVPAKHSPPLLHAGGPKATANGFDQLGIRPGLAATLLSGTAEMLGGFSLAAGLLTPVGTILIGADMTTAILTVHARHGIWNAEGGFEFPLVLMVVVFVITALGAGSYSINAWAHVNNWAGIHNSEVSDAARAGISLAVGVVGGFLTVIASRLAGSTRANASIPTTG